MSSYLNTFGPNNLGVQVGQNHGDINFFRDKEQETSEQKFIEFMRLIASNYKDQKNIHPIAALETCEWVLEDPVFTQWRDSTTCSLLHIYAGPGCGKSVFTRYLIDGYTQHIPTTSAVLYHFFSKENAEQSDCASAAAAWLHQLYCHFKQPELAVHALSKYESLGDKLRSSFTDLWEIFTAIANDIEARIVCVLDALDECSSKDWKTLREQIAAYSRGLQNGKSCKGNVSFLFTSRANLGLGFDVIPSHLQPRFTILNGDDKAEMINEEINRMIDATVPITIPNAGKKAWIAVSKALQEKNNRTYLWLHLIFQYLQDECPGPISGRNLVGLLSKLPPGVREAYENMLNRSKDRIRTKRLLSIMVASQRPLTISEAKLALEISQFQYSYLKDIEVDQEDEQFKDHLKVLCGSLVTVHNSTLHFLHETARDFLLRSADCPGVAGSWEHSIEEDQAHYILANACLSFLRLRDFEDSPPWTSQLVRFSDFNFPDRFQSWITSKRFLSYAATYWIRHYAFSRIIDRPVLDNQVLQVLPGTHKTSYTWFPLFGFSKGYIYNYRPNALAFASTMGFHTICKQLIVDHQVDVEAWDGLYGTALNAASTRGDMQLVKMLLDHGANVDSRGGFDGNTPPVFLLDEPFLDREYYLTTLETASYHRHYHVLQLFLDISEENDTKEISLHRALRQATLDGDEGAIRILLRHISVDVEWDEFFCPLGAALANGHHRIADMLIDDYNADVTLLDTGEWNEMSGLEYAAECGSERVLRLLLQSELVRRGPDELDAAIQVAAHEGHIDIVRLLLDEYDAPLNSGRGWLGGVFQAAAKRGNVELLEILLDKYEVDSDSQGHNHQIALSKALTEGHWPAVQLLVRRGIDLETRDGDVSTLLSAAVNGGDLDCVKMILKRYRITTDKLEEDYGILRIALYRGSDDCARLLISHGAKVNALDEGGNSMLELAAAYCSTELVQLLIDSGADVHMASTGHYGNALIAAASNSRQLDTLELLLDKGIKINAKCGYYGTALQAAATRDDASFVQFLLRHQANVNGRGGRYGTALQAAAAESNPSVIEVLLEQGAEVNAVGGCYHTALIAATSKRRAANVELLLSHGADVNIQRRKTSDPLRVAPSQYRRNHEILQRQLQHRVEVFTAENDFANALQAAAAWGSTDILQFLLHKGADVNAIGGYYGTAVQAAAAKGHTKVLQVLIAHRADINASGGKYGTALQAAVATGHKEIEGILLDQGDQALAFETSGGDLMCSDEMRQ